MKCATVPGHSPQDRNRATPAELDWRIGEVLLMEEILHQLICGLSHYLRGFIHPRARRISSINSISQHESFDLLLKDMR